VARLFIRLTKDAVKTHASQLRTLFEQLYPGELLTDPQIDATLDHKANRVFGVLENNVLVGIATLTIIPKFSGTVGCVEDVVVLDTHRGKGIGRELFLRIERFALKNGATRVDLMTRPENKGTLRFYLTIGFNKIRRQMFRKKL
jgi:GNAT superfamily N-acetyltransferase